MKTLVGRYQLREVSTLLFAFTLTLGMVLLFLVTFSPSEWIANEIKEIFDTFWGYLEGGFNWTRGAVSSAWGWVTP